MSFDQPAEALDRAASSVPLVEDSVMVRGSVYIGSWIS